MKYLECYIEPGANGVTLYYIDGKRVNRDEFLKALHATPEDEVTRLSEDIKFIRDIIEKRERRMEEEQPKDVMLDCGSFPVNYSDVYISTDNSSIQFGSGTYASDRIVNKKKGVL